VPFSLEIEAEPVGDVPLVFDDEDSTHSSIAAGVRDSGFKIRFMKQDEAVRA
jgi:hypothetical protein